MKVVNIVVENAVVTDVAELSVVLVLTGDVGPEELSNLVGVEPGVDVCVGTGVVCLQWDRLYSMLSCTLLP